MKAILLQAGMLFGAIGIITYVTLLFILLPLISGIIMKTFWKIRKKTEYLSNNYEYYKDPIYFIISLLISLIIITSLFYYFILLNFNLTIL
jgi:hypothetical protein